MQLLIPKPPCPFTSAFPHTLPLLSIDILALAGLPEIEAHISSGFDEKARIIDVQLAVESLEVGLVLSGGEVLVYRMADRQSVTARQLPDKRLVSLEHVPVADGLRFKPYFLITAELPVTAFAISDVGEHSSHTYDLFFSLRALVRLCFSCIYRRVVDCDRHARSQSDPSSWEGSTDDASSWIPSSRLTWCSSSTKSHVGNQRSQVRQVFTTLYPRSIVSNAVVLQTPRLEFG